MPVSTVHLSATGLTLPRDPEGSRIVSVTVRPCASSFALAAASVCTFSKVAAQAPFGLARRNEPAPPSSAAAAPVFSAVRRVMSSMPGLLVMVASPLTLCSVVCAIDLQLVSLDVLRRVFGVANIGGDLVSRHPFHIADAAHDRCDLPTRRRRQRLVRDRLDELANPEAAGVASGPPGRQGVVCPDSLIAVCDC